MGIAGASVLCFDGGSERALIFLHYTARVDFGRNWNHQEIGEL
jgi:hypothetical protein